MLERIKFDYFKNEVLKDSELKLEYDRLNHAYKLRRKSIYTRKEVQ